MIFKTIFCLLFCIQLCFAINVDVKTSSGLVRGRTIQVLNRSIDEFIGIPYAKPPIGELRFRKPEPITEPLKGVIEATKIKDSCLQPYNEYMISIWGPVKQSEDCLFLNVWTPKSKDQKSTALKPVMFWIHGGGLVFGSSFQAGYNGSALASNDVVIVSINYRLGPLGFFYGDDTTAPANVGFFDQLLALKWVRENIHLFGGDKDQITIFGESAGSWSVSAQVLSPLSKGLYKRAIMESGAHFYNRQRDVLSKSEALIQSKQIANSLNCTESKEWLQCLRKVDGRVFIDSFKEALIFPIVGTEFLPLSGQQSFDELKFNQDLDILSGVAEKEGSLLAYNLLPKTDNTTEDDFKQYVGIANNMFHNIDVDNVTRYYLRNVNTSNSFDLKEAFYEFYGDLFIKCPTYLFAKHYSQKSPKSNVFFYEITYQRKRMIGESVFGVTHGAEIDFVFGLPYILPGNNDTDVDIEFSKQVMTLWTDFAKFGKPSHQWPQLIRRTDGNFVPKIQDLNPKYLSHVFVDPFKETCDEFWGNYF